MEFEIPVPLGIALMIGSLLWSIWEVLETRRLRRRFSVHPWLSRPDWREGIVYDKSRKEAWWNAVAAGGVFFVGLGTILWSDLYAGEGWVPPVMLFAFAGIPFGRRLYKALRRRSGFALSFRFDRLPFRIGEPLVGTIHLKVPPEVEVTFVEVSLATLAPDSDGDMLTTSEMKRNVYSSQVARRGVAMRVPIEFAISSGKPSSQPFHDQPLLWELRFSVPEIACEAEFVVPVFACAPEMVRETNYGRRARRRAAVAADHSSRVGANPGAEKTRDAS
ncbi:MAG: hypothetical protein ABI837_16260 [Acidobacteriota bacterium]